MRRGHSLKASFVGLAFFALPLFAFAESSAVVKTTQLLPPGGSSCTQPVLTTITPYVYNGHLDSFDIVIRDNSYVAIGGRVGDTSIPFNYMTRSITPDGQLRIHTDIESTSGGMLPVSVTLLSAANNMTCASVIVFYVKTSPAPSHSGAHHISYAPTKSTQQKSHPSVSRVTVPASTASTSSSWSLQMICTSVSGALKLWLVLLVLYAILAGIAVYIQSRTPQRSPAVAVLLIIVPLILLVGFWYLVGKCRLEGWVPIVLLIIAVAALLAAFYERRDAILLPPNLTKSKTPPPTGSKPTTPTTAPASSSKPLNPHAETIRQRLEQIQRSNRNKPKGSEENPPQNK